MGRRWEEELKGTIMYTDHNVSLTVLSADRGKTSVIWQSEWGLTVLSADRGETSVIWQSEWGLTVLSADRGKTSVIWQSQRVSDSVFTLFSMKCSVEYLQLSVVIPLP